MIVDIPQVGDVGLIGIGGLTGKFIRFGQWLMGIKWSPDSEYEHSLIYVGNGMAVEAQPGGAIMYHLDTRWNTSDILWIRVADLDDEQKNALVLEAAKLVGTPYSFLDYLAIMVHHFHLPFPGLKSYVSSTKHMICSQLVAEVYRRIGIHLFDAQWPGYVMPANYYEKFSG